MPSFDLSRRRTALLMAPALALGAARPAAAHALVLASDPAAGARLPAAPDHATLRFNSRLDRDRSRLTLLRVGSQPINLPLLRVREPSLMEAALPRLEPGEWRLRWQVLAADGHITRGDIAFTVTGG